MITKLRMFYLLTGLTGGVFIPYLSLLLIHDGLSSAQIGIVMALGTFVSLVIQPIWGMVVDRYQVTRLVLVVGCIVPALYSYLYNRSELWIIVIVNILTAVVSAPQAPLTDTYAVKYGQLQRVSYGSMRCFGSLGFALASYVGGLYVTHFSVGTLFLPYAVLGLLAAFTAFTFPKETQTDVGFSVFQGLSELFRNGKFLLFLCGGLLISQTLTAFNTYFVLAFKEQGGTMAITGIAFLLASGTNIPAMLVASKVIRKFGSETTMAVSGLAYVVRWAVQAWIPNPYVAISIQILHGVSFGFFYVTAVSYVSKITSKHIQATGQSIFAMVTGSIAGILGNLVNGYLLHTGGPTLMYNVCAISSLLGCICFLVIGIQTRRSRMPQSPIQESPPSV